MKVLYAEFTARPGKSDEVAALLRALAVQVRQEPGNRVFDMYRETENPDRYFVFEAYQDDEAFRAHLAMPYGGPFNDALSDLIEEPRSVLTFLDAME